MATDDEKVLELLREAEGPLRSGEMREKLFPGSYDSDYRRMDRILKRLKSQGLIALQDFGWVAIEKLTDVCPTCQGKGRVPKE